MRIEYLHPATQIEKTESVKGIVLRSSLRCGAGIKAKIWGKLTGKAGVK